MERKRREKRGKWRGKGGKKREKEGKRAKNREIGETVPKKPVRNLLDDDNCLPWEKNWVKKSKTQKSLGV